MTLQKLHLRMIRIINALWQRAGLMSYHCYAIKAIAQRKEYKKQSHIDPVFPADQVFFEADVFSLQFFVDSIPGNKYKEEGRK